MERLYNSKLTTHIHDVSRRFAMKEDEIKEANKQLTEVLDNTLIPVMKKEDEYFEKMFQRFHYSGSYYENLRICKPDEFDINLELRSKSKNEKFFQIFCDESPPGFVQIQRKSGAISEKWIDEDGFVLQNKVFSWLQSVVDKALKKITTGPWFKISRKTSGPAITLYVEYTLGMSFSVDLVPVFVFDDSEWLKPPVREPVVRKKEALEWCVVPKPYNKNIVNDRFGKAQTFWRISFYNQEKVILNNKNHLKNALKIFKLLRNGQGWHVLSSYYIKTVYLWALVENEDKFWNFGIGVLFMEMLSFLKDNLKNKHEIAFFWDRRHNLLGSVNIAEIEKIGNRIENIIGLINRNINNEEWLQRFFYSQFSGENARQNLQITEVTELDGEAGGIQLVERPLEQANVLFPGQNTLRMSPEEDDQSLKQAQPDWIQLAIGVGALAVGATYIYRALKK